MTERVFSRANIRANPLQTGVALYETGLKVWGFAQGQRAVLRNRNAYIFSIEEGDQSYNDVQHWVLNLMPEADRKALIGRSIRTSDDYGTTRKLTLHYDGDREQVIYVDGHEIKVSIQREGGSPNTGEDVFSDDPGFAGGTSLALGRRRLAFECSGELARNALINAIAQVVESDTQRTARFYSATEWGGWSNKSAVRARNLDSVILRSGVKEALVGDIESFLSSEDRYNEWNVPWHRGYLLYGPPGTGKTSLATAISTELKLDVRYLALSTLKNDAALSELFAAIPARSMVLIEDIDVAHSAKTRTTNDDESGVTTAGLLNVLDGMATPHGLIVFMTTNRAEVLDPALARTGRADVQLLIDYVDDDQVARLAEHFLGYTGPIPHIGSNVASADVMNELKKGMEVPEFGIEALISFVENSSIVQTDSTTV